MEKKTFKNPHRSYFDSVEHADSWYLESQDLTCHYFKFDEWDMEVTFTKKHRPLKVGDKLSTDLGFNPQTVIGVHKDQVWLVDCDDDTEVYWLSDFEYTLLDSTDS